MNGKRFLRISNNAKITIDHKQFDVTDDDIESAILTNSTNPNYHHLVGYSLTWYGNCWLMIIRLNLHLIWGLFASMIPPRFVILLTLLTDVSIPPSNSHLQFQITVSSGTYWSFYMHPPTTSSATSSSPSVLIESSSISPWISISTQLNHQHIDSKYAGRIISILWPTSSKSTRKSDLVCHGEICNKTQCHSKFQLHTIPDFYWRDDLSGGGSKGYSDNTGCQITPISTLLLVLGTLVSSCVSRSAFAPRPRSLSFLPFLLVPVFSSYNCWWSGSSWFLSFEWFLSQWLLWLLIILSSLWTDGPSPMASIDHLRLRFFPTERGGRLRLKCYVWIDGIGLTLSPFSPLCCYSATPLLAKAFHSGSCSYSVDISCPDSGRRASSCRCCPGNIYCSVINLNAVIIRRGK